MTDSGVWRGFLAASAAMLGFLALSLPFVERGTGTFVITLLSATMLLVVFLGSALFVYLDWDPFEELLDTRR